MKKNKFVLEHSPKTIFNRPSIISMRFFGLAKPRLLILIVMFFEAYFSAAQTEYFTQTVVALKNESDLKKYLLENVTGLEGLRLNAVKSSPVGLHYDYFATRNGKIVYGTSVKAHVNRDFTLYAYHVFLWPPSETTGTWSAPFPELKAKVVAADSGYKWDGRRLFAAYRIETYDHDGGDEIFFDAKTGQIRQRLPRAVRQSPRGYVFHPDPVTAAFSTYDCSTDLCDNDDQTNPTLDALRVEVKLEGLTFEDSVYSLAGPYVAIVDVAPPARPRPVSTDGMFFFDRSHPDFEAVNIYFHIHRYRKYLDSLGLTGICEHPVKADARGSFGDNSFFTSDDSGGLLQFGVGGVDDGEDADVILHEYAHALSACAAPGTNEGFERKAADEGFGDYVAASTSYDLSPYRWADIFTWDGHNEFWAGRSAQEPRTWPQVLAQSSNNIYSAGTVWAGALINARRKIPKKEADLVVVTAQYFNARNMSMRSAAHALLTADSLINQRRYRRIFLEEFCRTQILTDLDCAPLSRNDLNNLVRVYPLPARKSFVVEFQGSVGKLSLFDATGKTVYDNPQYRNETTVNIETLPAGMYILSVTDSANGVQRLKIPVAP